jgi:acyl dehydratase
MKLLYLEDFAVGQVFRSAERRVTAEEIKAFAGQYDPQPFHLDEAAAASSFFRGLAASGWHTTAMTMRLLVESELRIAGGVIGGGVEELRWPRPVRPGDTLHVETELVEVRPSASRPDTGWLKARSRTINQNGETVQEMTANLLARCRAVADAPR